MIRGRFLSEEDRGKLVALVRDGSAASRVTRRANALVLLDGGWSCQEVAANLVPRPIASTSTARMVAVLRRIPARRRA
jgi:hypothetical protein